MHWTLLSYPEVVRKEWGQFSHRTNASELAVLRNHQYLRLWLGQVVSLLGDQFAYMGLSFLILFRLGGTAVDVGLMLLVASLPTLLIAPLAGVCVDRWSRRRVMVVADLVRAGIYIGLLFARSLPAVYLGVFCANTASRFFAPARAAFVPEVVNDDELIPALALGQTSAAVTLMLGPALGGMLAADFGTTFALLANAVSFLISAVLVRSVRIRENHVAEVSRESGSTAETRSIVWTIRDDLRSAWHYARRNRLIRFITVMYGLFVFLAEGMNVLFVPFLKNTVGLDLAAIGRIEMAEAVGGLFGAGLMLALARRHRSQRIYFFGICGMGMLLAVIAITRAPSALTLLFGLVGAMLAVVSVPHDFEMVRLVPTRLRGRIFGTVDALTDTCAIAAAGLLPELAVLGTTALVVGIGGLATIAVGVLGLTLADRITHDRQSALDL